MDAVTGLTRAALVAAAAEVLDEHAGACVPVHRELGGQIADRLGIGSPGQIDGPGTDPGGDVTDRDIKPSNALDLGVWIDDPPRLVLDGRYLDRLLELPLGHVAVMLDGPEPGLDDARWDWRDLELLRQRLPDPEVDRILTTWIAPDAEALDELDRELPRLLDALGAHGLEGDVEPAGHWRERDVDGFRDLDGDGRRLDDAAAAIAEVLCGLHAEIIETTTFPGALRVVRILVEEIAARAAPGVRVRYVSQDYAVARRNEEPIAWDGPLGPERFALESREKAAAVLPARVELCSGAAAYRTVWPDGRDSLPVAIRTARGAGARLVRLWSSKWLARKDGHERRRARVLEGLAP